MDAYHLLFVSAVRAFLASVRSGPQSYTPRLNQPVPPFSDKDVGTGSFSTHACCWLGQAVVGVTSVAP
eukprot:2396666-Amphidinium_carterae.1